MLTALPRTTPTLTTLRGPVSVRLAVYGGLGEPPAVRDIVESDPAILIERVFEEAAGWTHLPVLAVREVIENLAHARFAGALVSVYDNGATMRVSDLGPGIADVHLAEQPGYTTADVALRALIRGVGSGLGIARAQLEGIGGTLDIGENITMGTVVTLRAPVRACDRTGGDLDQDARHLLALLVELASADAATLASELGLSLPECGRALTLLEQRGLINRAPCGSRSITPRGNDLIASLF